MRRKRNRRAKRTQSQEEEDYMQVPLAMIESGRRRSTRLKVGANENERSTMTADTKEDAPGGRDARPARNTKKPKSKRSLIVTLPIATAALQQLEECGIIFSQDMGAVQPAPQSLVETDTAESLSDLTASSQGTQDQDEDDGFPVPLAMMDSGRRRSARLNGGTNDNQGSMMEVDGKEEKPGRRAAVPARNTNDSQSQRSLVVRLAIATAALRQFEEYRVVVRQDMAVLQPAPQCLPETEAADSLHDRTGSSTPELQTLSKSPPASDITRSHAMSPRLQANHKEYPADDAPALLPIVYPKLPRTIPWSAYKAFNIPLPTDQAMPSVALETPFQPSLALPSAPPLIVEPYHCAAPSMLAEVLEMTRHQARLQVLQSSALRCLDNYHYWSIHNPILCVPYKAFFRLLERELNGELHKARRHGDILEEMQLEKMQVEEWMKMEQVCGSDEIGVELQGEWDIAVDWEKRDAPAPGDGDTCGDTALVGTARSLHTAFETLIPPVDAAVANAEINLSKPVQPHVPPAPVELEIRARINTKSNAAGSVVGNPHHLAVKDAVPVEEVGDIGPSPGITQQAPGPLEMAIRAKLEKNKGKDIRPAKRQGAVVESKANAATKAIGNTKKQLKVQVRSAQPGLVNTPPPTSIAYGKNQPANSSKSSDPAEQSEQAERQGQWSLHVIETVVPQQLVEKTSSISRIQRDNTQLIWKQQVPTRQSQQPQFTPQHYHPQPYQQLELRQHQIPLHPYPHSNYRQQQEPQAQLQPPSLLSQQHLFDQQGLRHIRLQQISQVYPDSAPSSFPPRKKPWELGYHQQRDLVLDPPSMTPNNWNAVHSLMNTPQLPYYLTIRVCRQQFTTRLQLLSGHLQSSNEPPSGNFNRLLSSAGQPTSSNLVLPYDHEDRLHGADNAGFSGFVEPWKCPTADPGARCPPAGNYKILLWQHPLTLDLPTEFLEQGALEPPMRESSEEKSPPPRMNRTSHGGRLSDSRFHEPPEITRISNGDESCYATIFSPHVPAQELVPSTHVVTGRVLAGKTATSRSSSGAASPEGNVENGDAQPLSAIFANATGKQKLVAPIASMYPPPTLAPSIDETPLFLDAGSPGESVYFGETDDHWEFSGPMDDDEFPAHTFTDFTDGGVGEPRISKPAAIINQVLGVSKAKSVSDDRSRFGIPATSNSKAPTALSTNTTRAAISENLITPNIIAQAPSIQPPTAPGKATYTGPPITIPRTLLQKPPTNIPPRLTTPHAVLPCPTTTHASRPINLGHLLKNIHPPLPSRNTSLPTSAKPPPSRSNQTGPKITAEARKQITMRKNAEERRKQRAADAGKDVVTENGKGMGEEKGRELTGAEVARQIIARKYGEGGAKRIYLTPGEILGGGVRGPDKGKGNEEDGEEVGRLVLDERVGHEGELLPIEVAEAMKQVPGKQRRRPQTDKAR